MTTVNFTKPVTSDLRADVLAYIRDYMAGQAKLFDGDTLVSLPVGTVRYSSANSRFEIWNGATWDTLNITGQGFSLSGHTHSYLPLTGGTLTGVLNVDDGTGGYVQLKSGDSGATGYVDFRNDADARVGYIGYAASSVINLVSETGWSWKMTGNFGIGATSSAWEASVSALSIGAPGTGIHATTGSDPRVLTLRSNTYVDAGGTWRHAGTGISTAWNVGNNGNPLEVYSSTVSQTAGTAVGWSLKLVVAPRGDMMLGSGDTLKSWGTSGPAFQINNASGGTLSLFQSPGANDSWICSNSYYDGSTWRYSATGYSNALTFYNGELSYQTAASGTAAASFAYTDRARLFQNGGFRIYSPAAGRTSLVVDGPASGVNGAYAADFLQGNGQNWGKVVRIGTSDSGGGDGPQIHFFHSGISEWGFGMGNNDSYDLVMYYGGNTAQFGTERFRFDYAGNFTMTGTNPTITLRDTDHNTAYLHCNSDTFYVLRGPTNSGYGGWSAVGSGAWPFQINLTNNDANFGGNLTATYNVTAYSDERLKKDFAPAIVTLEQMLMLEPESFLRIDSIDPEKPLRQVGVRAQRLMHILPEAINIGPDGYLSANYGAAAMVLALNLAREVAALKARLA